MSTTRREAYPPAPGQLRQGNGAAGRGGGTGGTGGIGGGGGNPFSAGGGGDTYITVNRRRRAQRGRSPTPSLHRRGNADQ